MKRKSRYKKSTRNSLSMFPANERESPTCLPRLPMSLSPYDDIDSNDCCQMFSQVGIYCERQFFTYPHVLQYTPPLLLISSFLKRSEVSPTKVSWCFDKFANQVFQVCKKVLGAGGYDPQPLSCYLKYCVLYSNQYKFLISCK